MEKNYKELEVVIHNNKTLATSVEFYEPKGEEEYPFREPNLSRLDISLLTKTGEKSEVYTFNIPASEINEVKLKTEIAIEKLMMSPVAAKPSVSEAFASNPAFTVQLALRPFTRKTPGEVLMEDSTQKERLLECKETLLSNLGKYPTNQKQIDAIDDAIKLFEVGELNASKVPASSDTSCPLVIYKREFKYKSKKDDKGNCLAYSVTITCNPAQDLPFTIEVENCYAPLKTVDKKTVVEKSLAVNKRSASISLSDSEWVELIFQAYDLYENFKKIIAPAAFKRAKERSYSHSKE